MKYVKWGRMKTVNTHLHVSKNVNSTIHRLIFIQQLTIDDSDEDLPVMKATRPPSRFVSVVQHSKREFYVCVCVCLNLFFSLIYHRTSSSSSITKYSSQSQSQSTRGITFDDSDDDDDAEVTQWYSRAFFLLVLNFRRKLISDNLL